LCNGPPRENFDQPLHVEMRSSEAIKVYAVEDVRLGLWRCSCASNGRQRTQRKIARSETRRQRARFNGAARRCARGRWCEDGRRQRWGAPSPFGCTIYGRRYTVRTHSRTAAIVGSVDAAVRLHRRRETRHVHVHTYTRTFRALANRARDRVVKRQLLSSSSRRVCGTADGSAMYGTRLFMEYGSLTGERTRNPVWCRAVLSRSPYNDAHYVCRRRQTTSRYTPGESPTTRIVSACRRR